MLKYSLPKERKNKDWKDITWGRLVHNEKKICVREYLYNSISISPQGSSGIYLLTSGINSNSFKVDTINLVNTDTNMPMPTVTEFDQDNK